MALPSGRIFCKSNLRESFRKSNLSPALRERKADGAERTPVVSNWLPTCLAASPRVASCSMSSFLRKFRGGFMQSLQSPSGLFAEPLRGGPEELLSNSQVVKIKEENPQQQRSHPGPEFQGVPDWAPIAVGSNWIPILLQQTGKTCRGGLYFYRPNV